jgi:hypothetical protein
LDLDFAIARGTTDAAAMEDLSALLKCVKLYGSYNRVEELVHSILNDPATCNKVVHSNHVGDRNGVIKEVSMRIDTQINAQRLRPLIKIVRTS